MPVVTRVQKFLRLESASGIILMLAAVLALIASNTILSPYYDALLSTPMQIRVGPLDIAKPLLLWINDGLMAIFFFLVGLEIKREVVLGELSDFDKAALPLFAAVGGMAAPALIYAGINLDSPETINGWAIPAATDIAFALGILTLAGSRVPVSLKVFLLAVAIIDDLGAIVIIALFYTADLSLQALAISFAGLLALISLNRAGVVRIAPYVLVGAFVWVCVLKSGVHATLAGVVTALAIPLRGSGADAPSPLQETEHKLHPWVAFMVLPVFAFANAGVSFEGITPAGLLEPIPFGIALGLLLGKPLGILALSYLAVRTGLARLPQDVDWLQLAGVGCLAGVGFTMSLFIGGLAFETSEQLNAVRLGVLAGSLLSGTLGFLILRMQLARAHPR
jgi:NhaA family Na+:H+ antiporter